MNRTATAEQGLSDANIRASQLSAQLLDTISNFEGLVKAANTAQAALIQRTRRQTVGGNDATVMQGVANSLQQAITEREALIRDAKKAAEAVAEGLQVRSPPRHLNMKHMSHAAAALCHAMPCTIMCVGCLKSVALNTLCRTKDMILLQAAGNK